MNTISVSQLKLNPAAALNLAEDYPVQITGRNEVRGYLVGKDIYEKMLSWIEDGMDVVALAKSEYPKGKKAEDLMVELGL